MQHVTKVGATQSCAHSRRLLPRPTGPDISLSAALMQRLWHCPFQAHCQNSWVPMAPRGGWGIIPPRPTGHDPDCLLTSCGGWSNRFTAFDQDHLLTGGLWRLGQNSFCLHCLRAAAGALPFPGPLIGILAFQKCLVTSAFCRSPQRSCFERLAGNNMGISTLSSYFKSCIS